LPVVAKCCGLSGVSVVSSGVSFAAVVAGICAASSAVAVALIALGGEEEFATGGILAEAGHFVLDNQ